MAGRCVAEGILETSLSGRGCRKAGMPELLIIKMIHIDAGRYGIAAGLRPEAAWQSWNVTVEQVADHARS